MEANEPFIGRQGIRKFLLDEIFLAEHWVSKFCPIVAPRGFGKTELIRAVVWEFEAQRPENTFHFFINLEPGDTYATFWARLLRRITETIDHRALVSRLGEKGDMDDYACQNAQAVKDLMRLATQAEIADDSFREALNKSIKQLFEAYCILNVRIVITVDDFDRARHLEPDIYESLANIGIGTHLVRRNLVSVITLSRSWIHSEREEDRWETWVAPFYLGGFSNAELGHYFATYRKLPCGMPTQETQMRILYLCGRSPEMLMRMRHNLSGMKNVNEVDMLTMYECDRRYFEHVLHNIYFSMRHFYADEWRLDTLADLFDRQLLTPSEESLANAAEELALLRQHGFVTRELARSNLLERLGLGIPPSVERTRTDYIYEPISPFLLDFIRSQRRTT